VNYDNYLKVLLDVNILIIYVILSKIKMIFRFSLELLSAALGFMTFANSIPGG